MKNILSEELNRMKYLFGHQRGVVISEQVEIRQGSKGDPYQYKKDGDKYYYAKKGNENWTEQKNQKGIDAIKTKIFDNPALAPKTSDNKTATDYFTATGVSVQGAFDQIAEGKEKMNNETFNTFAYFIKSAPRVENGLVVGKVDGVGSKLNPEEFKTKYKDFGTYTFVPTPDGGFKAGVNVEQKANAETTQGNQGTQETQTTQTIQGIYAQFALNCKNYITFDLSNEVKTFGTDTYVRTENVKVVDSGQQDKTVGCRSSNDLSQNIALFSFVGVPDKDNKTSIFDQTGELNYSAYIVDNGAIQNAINKSKETLGQDVPEKTAAQVEQEGQSQWCKDNTVPEFDEKCFSINVKPGETEQQAADKLMRIGFAQGYKKKREQNFNQEEGTLEQIRAMRSLSKEERQTREERKPKTNVGDTGQSMYAFNKDTESMIEVSKKLEGFGPNEQSYLRDLLKNTKGGKLGVGEGNNYERAERRALRDAKDQLGGAEPKVAGEKKYAYNPDTKKYKYGVVATA